MAPAGGRRRPVEALLLVAACGACLFLGFWAFGFAGCHSGPGFCAGEYTSSNTQMYGIAAVLGGLALMCLVALFTRRGAAVALAFPAGVAAVALAALVSESG